MEKYLMGVDLGTTNVKAAIYDLSGTLVARGEAGSYRIVSQRPNWAEQDARLWWQDTVLAIRQALRAFDKPAAYIAGISVSSQGMAMLPLDADGEPLALAHIWMDRRGTEEARFIEEHFGSEKTLERFGVRCDPYYQITNVMWFQRHQPELWAKTRRIVKANTYLNYRLTGEFALDIPQAMMTMAWDMNRRAWCTELGSLIGIDLERIMPRVMPCEAVLGQVTRRAAAETLLAEGTPVMVSSMDTGLALLEMGVGHRGDGAEITGTSSNNVFAAAAMPPHDSGISFFPPVLATPEAPVLLYGPTNATGENIRWFRRIGGMEDSCVNGEGTFDYIERVVDAAAPGSGGLYYYPYLMGERAPLWNNDLRGMFIGIHTNTGRGEMLRAIYEGTCFAQKEIMETACRDGNIDVERMFVSGGCAHSNMWMRIKASILKMPVHVMTSGGGAPKGNAILAGYGIGLYPDLLNTAASMRHIDRTFEPDPEWVAVYNDMYPLFLRMRNHLMGDLTDTAQVALRAAQHKK